MDSPVRVKFRLVIPLVVGFLALVIWVIFHSRGNGQELCYAKIQRMEDIIREKDVAIAQIKDQLRRQVTNTKIIVKSVEKQDIPVPVTKTPVLEDSIKTRPFVGEKLVHIDLKGGAPKMAYLLKLLPTLKSWGATGLLVEYEDMFPYDQDLSVLKSPFAYRVAEITKLLTEVKKHDLLLVPLVQTFGHMEFVLKHKKFAHLRHIANMTNSVNPTDSGSVPLVKSMVEQIIKLHKPYIKYLHIGGDEVWSLKNCENCEGASKVYINHMTPIIDHVWDNQVIPILWDDMMRNWTIGELKHISLKHVQPMVWGYSRDLNHYFPPGMWTRYGQAFDKIWFASAFKGADTPYTNFVPIKDRIENHESWLKINAELHAQKSTMKVLGIALTGWSRFDHDATLCELLPVSLPSLALCLAVVKEGRMSDQTLLSVSRKLGFRDQIVMNPRQIPGNLEKPDEGTFPGHSLFGIVLRLSRAHNTIQSVEARMLAWFNERQVVKKSVSVYHLTVSLKRLDSALYRLQQVKDIVKKKFATFFNHDIIDEWTWDKIDSKRQRAIEIQQRLMKLKSAQSKNDRQSVR